MKRIGGHGRLDRSKELEVVVSARSAVRGGVASVINSWAASSALQREQIRLISPTKQRD